MGNLSKRLLEIVNALPLKKGIRVLEIGCGTGAAAREIASRIGNGKVLAIDRSPKAIEQAVRSSRAGIKNGTLQFFQAKIEEFELPEGEPRYDLAFAVRVGALDGRHPETEQGALSRIEKALTENGKLFIDKGNPLKEVAFRARFTKLP